MKLTFTLPAPRAGLSAPAALFDGLLMMCAVVPHLARLPLWCSGVALLAAAWVWASRRLRAGRRAITAVLALAAAALAWWGFGARVSGDGTLAFLAWALLLKHAESDTPRDRLFNVFGALMLAAWLPLYYESLAGIVLVVAASLLFFLGLYAGRQPAAGMRAVVAGGGARWLAALPFAAVLFAFFPRIPGPLWDIGLAMGLPIRQQVERAPQGLGVDERLTAEPVARASGRGNPTVLIAEFRDAVPSTAKLYWRGPVLWQFDGASWTPEHESASRGALMQDAYRSGDRLGAALARKEQLVRYAVRVMPNGRHWLYGLDLPASNPAESYITRDFQLLSIRRVRQETRFEGSAWLDHAGGEPPDAAQRALGLQLPEGSDARLIALGRAIAAGANGVDAIAGELARRFAGAGLHIAPANPVLPGPDALDRVFFDTRAAHPSQAAAAFAIVMRAAGVPTRLVAGFRGGRVMALTNYVIVKQNDAHVWVESWLPGSGWTRFEPVDLAARAAAGQAVPVARPIEPSPQPTPAQRPAADAPVIERAPAPEMSPEVPPAAALLDGLRAELDKWVLHFDAARQADLFARFGARTVDWRDVLAAAVAALGLLGALAWAIAALRERRARAPLAAGWRRVLGELESIGIGREPTECASAMCARVARLRPDLAERLAPLVAHYLRLRYGRADVEDLNRFVRAAKHFTV